ncbi:MAG: hypothetical protein J6X49_11355 [Victivallales bacterium]|nr:hypothetical protein [Victivallales bacterium]
MPAKIGLLPFYIALYDKTNPKRRPQMQANADLIAEEIRKLGVEVVQAPISCVKPEFEKSIKLLEDNKVDAIVTLHLAYSPSLESIDAVAGTDIPVVILDTTPDYDFNFNVDCGEKIGPNHGIHGVQDFSNLLIRRKKPFVLVAGHWKHSAVITAKLKTALEAATAASKFRNSRVGIIGKPFEGMGDFAVPYDKLKQDFNMTVVTYDQKDQPTDADFDKKVAAEMEADKQRFITDKLTPEAHKTTAETCIRVRDWMEAQKLDAFTASFLDVNRKDGWDTVPFLEASKALARGTGYAGEGDVLTANLVSAMLSIYPETTFTEMFCPDWQNDQIFLSHMGEANVDLYAAKGNLVSKPYNFSDTGSPAVAYGIFKPGPAILVNLAPIQDGKYRLLICNGICHAPENPAPVECIKGWFKPKKNLPEFLETYSNNGGTHHSALCYNADPQVLVYFAKLMGFEVVEVC